MEKLNFKYPASKFLQTQAHIGVVGSGDLEIVIEPSDRGFAEVTVRTGTTGFNETWKRVLERFFAQNDVSASILINDFGATPGVVSLRLAQALEVAHDAGYIKK